MPAENKKTDQPVPWSRAVFKNPIVALLFKWCPAFCESAFRVPALPPYGECEPELSHTFLHSPSFCGSRIESRTVEVLL
jgi:hypothetical protein